MNLVTLTFILSSTEIRSKANLADNSPKREVNYVVRTEMFCLMSS
jgi:hypothetical protein